MNGENNHTPTSHAPGLIHATQEPFRLIGPGPVPFRVRPRFRPPPMMPIIEEVPPPPREPPAQPPTFPPSYPPLITRNGRPVSPIPIHPRTTSITCLDRRSLPSPRATRTGVVNPSLPAEPFEPSPLRTTPEGIRLEITPASMQFRSHPETFVPRPISRKAPPPTRPTNPCRGCPRCRGPPELDPEA